MELRGAVVLVTGASRGIGRATAELLAARGAQVVCAGRDEGALDAVSRRCGGTALVADLRDAPAADELVQKALERHGRLDCVVSNAGLGHDGPVAEMTGEKIAELVDVNARAPLLLGRAAVAAFQAQAGAGDRRARGLCFITSIAGAVGVPGETVYSATKAAVEIFAALLREELRGQQVTVSTVLPGVVETDLLSHRTTPYRRTFPRPMSAERAAIAVVRALETGTPRTVVPRWLTVPARLSTAAPRAYRALARHLS
jgi:short-subunit dehydrogenase